jgi:hypothetical protein
MYWDTQIGPSLEENYVLWKNYYSIPGNIIEINYDDYN